MISCSMTLAYNIALINCLTPLIAPVMERIVLKTPLPKNLVLPIVVSVLGCAIVGLAQSPYLGNGEHHALTTTDLLGVILQVKSGGTSS